MSNRRTFLRGLVSLPLIGGSVAVLRQPAAAAVRRPTSFDAEAFVRDLIAAGCRVSVHQPVGCGAGPVRWHIHRGHDGLPTTGEREVRARWAAAMVTCPDADERVLAVCRRRAGVRL